MPAKVHILGIALLCALIASPAFAQWGQRPKRQQQDSNGTKFTEFNIPVEIPDVPTFSGKHKLVSGSAKETEEGTAYIQEFSTQERPEYVLPWYETALNNNQWKIVRKSSKFLSARKPDGSYCSVSTKKALPENAKESTCSFEISYFKLNPNHKSK